jgi:hypothetical protein
MADITSVHHEIRKIRRQLAIVDQILADMKQTFVKNDLLNRVIKLEEKTGVKKK